MTVTRLLERLANRCWRRLKWRAVSADPTVDGVCGCAKTRRCDCNRDLAAADHGAGYRALGLQVEHADDVAFGTVVQRLAADGEIEAGGFVDQRDILVALHQIGFGEIGGPQRLAGAKLPAHLHADRAGRGAAGSLPTSAFGRRSGITSEDFRTSLRSTLRVSTAASTVSIAVPVKRSLAGAALLSLAISKLTSKRPLRGSYRLETGCSAPVFEASSWISWTSRSNVRLRLAASPRPLRCSSACATWSCDFPGLDGARQPRHGDRLDVPGIDADHLMRLQRGDHLRGRQRAGGAEIGRAVDRDLRRCAGIVDHVADPHHVAGDGDAGAKHRNGDRLLADSGPMRPPGPPASRAVASRSGANDHRQLLHRNSAEVVCSIWSAALITLAFIS